MITKLTHVCVYVLDQDRAYDFYVNKLGFKVHTDAPMGPGARWLTRTANVYAADGSSSAKATAVS